MSKTRNRGAARAAAVGVSVAALCAMAACGGNNRATTDSAAGTVGATTAATTTGATTAAMPSNQVEPKNYSDPQILAAMEGSDSSEVAVAKLAESKASNAGVKSYARMLISDHTKALKDAKSLEKKANANAQTPPGDTTAMATSHVIDRLKGLKGMDFDTAFVNHEVEDHQHDIDDTKDMIDATKNTEVKTALQSSLPVLQKHLDRAKSLQDQLDKAKK